MLGNHLIIIKKTVKKGPFWVDFSPHPFTPIFLAWLQSILLDLPFNLIIILYDKILCSVRHPLIPCSSLNRIIIPRYPESSNHSQILPFPFNCPTHRSTRTFEKIYAIFELFFGKYVTRWLSYIVPSWHPFISFWFQ